MIKTATQKALKTTGLEKAGLKVEYIKEKKNIFKRIKNDVNTILNTGFNPKKNKIRISEKGLSLASFHEIGHAINYNYSKTGRLLQKLRKPCMALAALLGTFTAMTKTSKPKDGKKLTKFQKIKNYIRENVGKLTFAATLPVLIEEAMATKHGNNLARQFSPPELAQKVVKMNKMAYITYLITAFEVSAGAYAGKKVKDALVEKKEAKSLVA